MHPEGLLLHRGRSSSSARDDSAFLHSFLWESGHLRGGSTGVHPGSHAGFYQELLSAFSAGTEVNAYNGVNCRIYALPMLHMNNVYRIYRSTFFFTKHKGLFFLCQ